MARKNKFLILLGSLIFLLILLSGIVLFFLIYRLQTGNEFYNRLAHALPLPAVSVNGKTVTLGEYHDYFDGLYYFYAYKGWIFDEKAVKDSVLERLVANLIDKELAEKYEVRVSKEEIDSEYNRIRESVDDFEEQLEESFGWNIKDFKNLVLRPFALENKLMQSVPDFQDIFEESKNRAKIRVFVR